MIKVGEIYETNRCGTLEVIEYNGWRNILVEFIDTGFRIVSESGQIRNGQVRDRLVKTVYGVGFEGIGKYNFKKDKKAEKVFRHIFERCYSKKLQDKYPTYIGCNVDQHWHNFQNFCEWFYENYVTGWHLDKDLLIEGNKTYSAKTCIFVEVLINTLFTNDKQNNNLPLGVSKTCSGKYLSQCSINKNRKSGVSRVTIIEAEIDYLQMKSEYIILDIMERKYFPKALIEPFTLRINKMQDRIKLLQNG